MEVLRANWVKATDFQQKVDIATQIQELHYKDAIYVNLGQGFGFRAHRDYVKGVINHAVPIFWNVWLDK
jgi:ABC-type transport system substrate-binding protein